MAKAKSKFTVQPRFRVSLKSLLAIMAFAALACALVMQHFELARTRASLARYESSLIPTTLAPNQFRLIASTVLQTDHAMVIKYRIETANHHFATIASGGDSNGGRANHDPKTNLYVTEAVILIDHIKSDNVLKVMPKVSGAQGYTVSTVADDFSLPASVTVHNPEWIIREAILLHSGSRRSKLHANSEAVAWKMWCITEFSGWALMNLLAVLISA